MSEQIEISVGDVTDIEAYVRARYNGSESVTLSGKLRGPFCERGRTLPADFPFRGASTPQNNQAEAIVTDPCMWTLEMPHVYRVEVEALEGGRVIASYNGTIGLRRLAPRRPVDFAPGTG